MRDFVRRSNLLIPAGEALNLLALGWAGQAEGHPGPDPGPIDGEAKEDWLHIPDAVTLDLEDGGHQSGERKAGELIKEAIRAGANCAAEVFVRVNPSHLDWDLEVSVWPGIVGIMLPTAESADDVARASELMANMEGRKGIEIGSLELIVVVESALGVWNLREVINASPRVTQVAMDEGDLCCDLGITPTEEYDPFIYARGRLVIEGTALGVQPVGMAHPLGGLPRSLPAEELLRRATVAKDLGFKGAICPFQSWVQPVNTAFSPTAEQVDYYTEVQAVFSEGVAAGTATVPLRGRMIDVPVDEWAKVVIHRAEMCQARDAEKRRALRGELPA